MRRSLLWLAAVLGILTIQGCSLLYKDLRQPTVDLIGIQPAGSSEGAPLRLISRLRLSNPNDVDLPVKDGQLSLDLNKSQVATTRLDDDFVIPANGETDIDVAIDIDLMSALQLGFSLLDQQGPAIDWRLHGYIDLGSRYLGRVKVLESGTMDFGQFLARP
jgi:LEA14-like dessication related protein